MTYSFDIFDTCLIRKCGHPHMIFDLMASRILGKDAEEAQILDFKQIRIRSEQKARCQLKNCGKEEITLDEIYALCDFSDFTGVSNEIIKNVELQIEKEQLVAVRDIKNKIVELRKKGTQILFISDMYLPQDFIKNILIEQGLYEIKDKLYVSSECGITKGTGNLFKHVKEEENLGYHSWVHIGDNKYSDIKVPKSLGIKVRHISDSYNYYEKLWNQLPSIDNRYTNQFCASISRYIRLTSEKSPVIDIAADFIAPLYVSFVVWLMTDAQKRGIRQLYFVARDGLIFYEISKVLHDVFPDIKTSYLYASRKCLYLPGLDSVCVEDIEHLVMGSGLQNVLDCFQLDNYLEQLKKYEKLTGKRLYEALLKDDSFKSILEVEQKKQREITLKYFKQEGLHLANSAVVDLNGRRNCHKSICRILQRNGYPEPFGYFLSVSQDRITGKGYKSMFLFDSDENHRLRFTRSFPPIMISEEYFSMANHPTTKSYKENGEGKIMPVFGEELSDTPMRNRIYDINVEMCQKYATIYKDYINFGLSAGICQRALYIVTDFVFAPSYSLLTPFRGLTYSYTTHIKAKMLCAGSLIQLLKKRKSSAWFAGEFVDRFPIHSVATFILRIILFIRRMK